MRARFNNLRQWFQSRRRRPSLRDRIETLERKVKTIMDTQAEATTKINELVAEQEATRQRLVKIDGETRAQGERIKALEEAAQNSVISPELQAAIDAAVAGHKTLEEVAQGIDAQVDDSPATPPAEGETEEAVAQA